MSEKDEALRLADAFETHAAIPVGLAMGAIPCVVSRTELSQAAAELRSQHAENERLRKALEALLSLHDDPCPYDAATTRAAARAALRREDKT